jgi:hypothetical protein
MKKVFALLLFAAATACAENAPAPRPLTAAVLDFQTSKDFDNKGAEAATLLSAKLSEDAELMLVDRQEIGKTLGEQELGLSGTVTTDTAAKVGNLIGAKVLITGRLFSVGDKFHIVAKIIGTETSRAYGETATFTDPGAMDAAVAELATKLLTVINKRGDTLVAKEEDPAVRIERLKKIVTGKPLPTVSVQVSEQHISHFVIDPAAETEIKRILQQVGFTIVDSKASNKTADVSITGEAISEFGARYGNLVSCRGRVEIKMLRSAAGQVLLQDRQTGSGVDIAEDVAGKDALQNAASRLVDRIVPALVAQ